MAVAALGGGAGLLAWLIARSLDWPLIHDAPLMHYVAWRIADGAVPYRDLFDMNLPGAYLIHLGVLALAGDGDLPWRLFDLGWLAVTAALLYAYCRGLADPAGAAGAVLLFALWHLAGGAWHVGQRDFLLSPFLLGGALGVVRFVEGSGGLKALAWAGLLLGAATTVKPQAGLFWLACAGIATVGGRQAGWRPGITVLACGMVPPGLVLGWLAWRGGLRPFLEALTGYILPLYSQVGRVSPWEGIGWYAYGWPILGLLGALALMGTLRRAHPERASRQALARWGAVCGIAHYLVQGKGWEYHLYPLILFLCALAAPALGLPPAGKAAGGTDPTGPRRAGRLRWATATVALVAVLTVLAAKGVDALDAGWIADKARRVNALTRDLGPIVRTGDTAQALDVTAGGIHALLRLRLAQPTRFIYDFHFFHHPGDPRIEALRAELVAGLEAGGPAVVIVLRDSWPREGYERLEDFPALARLLARSYGLAVEGDGYRIYAKRSHS